MKLVSVLITCALFSKVYSLQCYECIPGTDGSCTQKTTTCTSSQCGGTSVATFMGNTKLSAVTVKSCFPSDECISGSINFGITRTTLNTKCCGSDLCNSGNVPEYPKNALNGKQCFTCSGNDCTSVLNCQGDENSCITVTATGSTLKGCVSKNICAGVGQSSSLSKIISGSLSCCDGNLCNDAHHAGQSLLLLLLLVSVVCISLFH